MTQLMTINSVKLQPITCSICKEQFPHPLSDSGHSSLTLMERDQITHEVCEECLLLLRG